MQVTFDGQEAPEVLEAGAALLTILASQRRGDGIVRSAAPEAPTPAPETSNTTDSASSEKPAPARRGRKPAQQAQTPEPTKAETPAAAAQAPAGPSKDDVRAALQSVVDVQALGMPAGMDALKAFKNAEGAECQAIRDLKAEDYGAFIEHCKGLVAKASVME